MVAQGQLYNYQADLHSGVQHENCQRSALECVHGQAALLVEHGMQVFVAIEPYAVSSCCSP